MGDQEKELRDFMLILRRALLMIVQAIERKYLCKDPVDIVQ